MRNVKKKHKKGISKYKGIQLIKVIALIMALCTIAVAENGIDDDGKKEVLTNLEKQMQKKISVDFKETPIDDVISIIADQADVDIIKSPKVIGNVTAKLCPKK